jgi:nanoRNase/pAp phosphatase (c-di-AMP/oligoRNAs hydrolase)
VRERLRAFLGIFGHTDNVLLPINPDPDSMASAVAVKRLLWKRVHRVVIAHVGEIQRLDNRAMVDLLRIQMLRLSEVAPDAFNRRVLIDSQPHHSEILSRFTYDAIIDHHPKIQNWDVNYVDIRPEYGATATILVEYLRSAKIIPSMKLATALIYAIKTDTSNFERHVSEADVRQFQYVFKYANLNRLRKIEKSVIKISDLDIYQTALERRFVAKNSLYAHLGEVPTPDVCVQIADLFMQVYGLGWTYVSGIYDAKLIIIIRNDGYRKDAGRLAIQTFGDLGSAGGHRGAARAEIPLYNLVQSGIGMHRSSLESFVKQRLKI